MAPVGSYESLMAAIQGGADSIYFGIEGLNMRSRSSNNFTTDDLRKIVALCREHGIKSYLTVNTVIYGEDLPLMREIIDAAKEAEVSAIIAADVAAMNYANSIGQEVHLSTQLNISNAEALKFYARFADVVVLARELNLKQVQQRKNYVLILAQTVIHSSLVVRDLLLPRDVSRSLTRNTDLNKNTHKKEGNLFFSFIGKPSLS